MSLDYSSFGGDSGDVLMQACVDPQVASADIPWGEPY